MDYTKLYKIENEARDKAFYTSELIMNAAADDLYMKYVVAKIPDFLGEIYSTAFQNIVEEMTIDHDKGDNYKQIYNFWKEEAEPEPPKIDTWARYRISSKIEEKVQEITNKGLIPSSIAKSFRGIRSANPSSNSFINTSKSILDKVKKGASSKENQRKRRFSYNHLHEDPDAINDFLNAPLYGVYTRAKNIPPSNMLQFAKRDHDKEQNGRKQMREKEKQNEKERKYHKEKLEEEIANEKKKKEMEQNRKRQNYTFDDEGNIIALKSRKEGDYAVNDIVDVIPNTSKKPKIFTPLEADEAKVEEAEIIERDNESEKGYFKEAPLKEKKPRLTGMFKPQPPLRDIIEIDKGVRLKMGKMKPIVGEALKFTGKMAKKDFEKKFSKLKRKNDEDLEGTETRMLKIEKQKIEKEGKYRKTVDNWKEEMKAAGLDLKMEFDPEKLIELIMTEEDPYLNREKLQRREFRNEKRRQKAEIQRKIQNVLKNPEKYLQRVTAFTKEFGDNQKKAEAIILNEFQKMNIKFNNKIVDGGESWGDKEVWDEPSMDVESRKFKLPQSRSQYLKRNNQPKFNPRETRKKTADVLKGPKSMIRVKSNIDIVRKSATGANMSGSNAFKVRNGVPAPNINLKIKKTAEQAEQQTGTEQRQQGNQFVCGSHSDLHRAQLTSNQFPKFF